MSSNMIEAMQNVEWKPQRAAQALVHEMVDNFLSRCSMAANLAERMHRETGTRLIDWVDFIQQRDDASRRARLIEVGFDSGETTVDEAQVFRHPGGIFPAILLANEDPPCMGLKVESVADFAAVHQIADADAIDGHPFAPMRLLLIAEENNTRLLAVERHGYPGFDRPAIEPLEVVDMLRVRESFRRRRRDFDREQDAFNATADLVDRAISAVGVDRACDAFFAAEREYWQRRNRAAQIQKRRQDALGLGWANHDHHTYRSSRRAYQFLIALFEKLGFIPRERFYAGQEAGWGAQVLEQPNNGIVIFADVDLSPDEVSGDFAHEPIPPRDWLGTVGLWCGLHGESIFQAGMHHLECMFDHDALRAQLEAEGVHTMDPFTELPYLRQAFTQGERWPVAESRINRLLDAGLITSEQAETFRTKGAIGSHLENLERHDGYKGFNQSGVSNIIDRTDPRKQEEVGA